MHWEFSFSEKKLASMEGICAALSKFPAISVGFFMELNSIVELLAFQV